MKHLRYLLMAALVAMPLTACDEDDDGTTGGTTEPPAVGTVSGTVSVEGTGLAGVSVTLAGATSQSATTGSGGGYSFANVEAGSYGVTIGNIPADVSFSTTAKNTSITTNGQTVTVDFSGSYIRTSSITGQVSASGAGVAGVAVAITGPEGTKNAVTDQAGSYSQSGLRAGNYTVTITPPADYTFDPVTNSVSLGVGEAKVVSFFGTKATTTDPVTAQVLIKSVTAGLTNAPVNPAAVAGQIDVTVQVDPGSNTLSKLCVLLDGAEVPNGCQTLSNAVAGQDGIQMVGDKFEVVFSILTGGLNTDGTPRWMNGNHTLSAKVDLANAAASQVETSMNLTFVNADFLATSVSGENSVTGTDNRTWLSGDITVTVTPVLYSGASLVGVSFNSGGATTRTVAAAPWTHTFPDYRSPNSTSSGAPGVQGVEAVGFAFVITSQYVGGTAGPAAAPTANIDAVAPPFDDFYDFILGTRWINEEHTFGVEPRSGAWPDLYLEAGSGFDGDILYYCGTSSASMAECTGGGDLAESFDNNAYLLNAVATDLGLNSNSRWYAGPYDGVADYTVEEFGATSSSTSASGQAAWVMFGVDHGNPTITQLKSAPNLRDKDMINTRTNSSVSYSDALSGFGLNPVATRITRWTPLVSGTAQVGCFVGAWSNTSGCGFTGTTGSINFPTVVPSNGAYTDGYYRTEMEVYDLADNASGELEWWNVRDATPPVNGGVANDAALTPGKPETFQALVTDNLDLNKGMWYLSYVDGAATTHRVHQGTNSIGEWGADAFTTSATATFTTSFVGQVEFGLGGTIAPATGMMLDLYDFGHTGAVTSTNIIGAENPFNTLAGASFGAGTADVAITGTAGAVSYGTGNVSICADLDFDGCLGATSGTSATLTLNVTGAGSAVGAPAPLLNQFQSVKFYARAVNDADVTDPLAGATDTWFELTSGVVSVTENAAATVRTYSYSGTITGDDFGDVGTFTVMAVGLNNDGRALAVMWTILVTID